MNKGFVVALDLGTTGNRVFVFDAKQRVVFSAYAELPQIFPKPGWVEHDPETIARSTQNLFLTATRKIKSSLIRAIGVTNQRETVLLWDKKTGKPIFNAIVWQCRRTSPFCEALKRKGFEIKIHQKTGLFLDAYFSASKIRWLLDHVPGARRRAEKGEILAGTIDSWIIWKLTGGRNHVTDPSNASRTMLFNLHSLSWDEELCEIFDVPMKILPEIVPSSIDLREDSTLKTDRGYCGREIPITGIAGDQQAASFAQGCYEPGIIKNTYGTGLFMLENTGSKPKFSKNLLTTVAWSMGSLQKTNYAVEGSVFVGGAAIQWLRDGLKIISKASESAAAAEKIASNEGVYFVPALVGLGAPYWDSSARGMFIGITRGTSGAHFIRAALESMAYQTKDILEVMKDDLGIQNKQTKQAFKALRVDGGASENNFLMQFQADVLGIPVERPGVRETTALGAAGLAGIGVHFWHNQNEFNGLRRIDKVFKPYKGNRVKYQVYYRQWKKAVERCLGWA